MKYFKSLSYLFFFIFSFLFFACNNNATKIDDFLDKFESTVKECEDLVESGNFTAEDVERLNQRSIELSSAGQKLQDETNWSSAQLERYSDLLTRFGKAIIKLSTR